MIALSHNDPRFDDVDYQPDYGGNTVPQHWRKHKASCCCFDCMKNQREADASSSVPEYDGGDVVSAEFHLASRAEGGNRWTISS